MRKRITSETGQPPVPDELQWLDLEAIAEIEVSSEAPGHPIEAALLPGHDTGWQAGEPGEQTIHVLFDTPQRLERIRLCFEEKTASRTQEFVLSWSPDGTAPFEEIVRQQYNFSPPSTVTELEEYQVQLKAVKSLQIVIRPELSGGLARASLARWQIA